MSLVDPDHIQPARQRHGAHYKMLRTESGHMAPGMIMFRDKESFPYSKDEKMCKDCFWTPFSKETKTCLRCGGSIE